MANEFVDFFRTLESYGLTDALLPFLLIFTILFSMLQKTNILGRGKRNFNVAVSAIMALLVVIPHITGTYPPGADVVEILNTALPNVSIVVVAILMALMIIGLLGGEARWMGGSLSGWFAMVAFGAIIYMFGGAAGWWEDFTMNWWDNDITTLIIVILVFAIVIWYVTKPDTSSDKAAKMKTAFDKIGDFFKPGS